MRHTGRQLLGLLSACTLAGCEIIADFDSGDHVEGRTIPPTPIMVEAGTPLIPDGSVRDGAVVTAPADAGLIAPDAAPAGADASAPPASDP